MKGTAAMVKLATLDTLAALEREMAQAGRSSEYEALRDALRTLQGSGDDFISTGQAAERLQVSIPTVKRWVERGALEGGRLGERWLIDAQSVARTSRLRSALRLVDEEGNPSQEEVQALISRHRSRREDQRASSAP